MRAIILLLLLVMPFAMVSCSKDDISESGIVGIWENSNGSSTYEFKENGELVIKSNGSSRYFYSVSKNVITLRIDGFKYPYNYKIEGDILTMKANYDVVFGGTFADEYRLTRRN